MKVIIKFKGLWKMWRMKRRFARLRRYINIKKKESVIDWNQFGDSLNKISNP